MYTGAFLLWSLASSAIGLAQGLAGILFLRLLLGLAESIGPIASMTYIRRNFSGAESGLPIGIYIAGQNLGPAAGTLLGTQLIATLGWRAMFIITGLGALVWLPGWLWFAPRDDGRAPGTTHVSAPVPWNQIIGMRAFWAMTMTSFLSSYYWYFVLTWVPTYLTSSRGFSTTEMGRVLAGPLFTMAIVNIAAGWCADRLVRRIDSVYRVRLWFCITGYILSGSVLLLLALPAREVVLPILVISVCGTGVGNANFWAIAQHTAPPTLVGRTIGYLNTISQIAGAMAPLITGFILGPEKQFGLALAIAGVTPPVAACLLIVAGTRGLETARRILSGVEPSDSLPGFRPA
jgi:MFS family permease